MAFTISLAHFCDKHGPKTILCTQQTDVDNLDQLILSNFSKESYCNSCLLIFPKNQIKKDFNKGNDNNGIKEDYPLTTIKTRDSKNKDIYYVTSQYSASKFRILNSIIKKCLSEETNNYDSKPMFFGDEIRGYSIVQSFKIKDLEARGSERRFSYVVNYNDEAKLLQNWDLIVRNITTIINYIKETSLKIELENSTNNELFLRGKMQHSKSLIELLNDDELFIKLHLWNAKLLKKLS